MYDRRLSRTSSTASGLAMNAILFVAAHLTNLIGTYLATACMIAGVAGLAGASIMQRVGASEPALLTGIRIVAIVLLCGAATVECWAALQQSVADCLAWWPLIGQQGWQVTP
jgi:hypothetical protein